MEIEFTVRLPVDSHGVPFAHGFPSGTPVAGTA